MRSARVLLALLATASLAQAAQEPTYDLKWKPRAEQTLRYKVSFDVVADDENVGFDWDVRTKVLKVEANGDYEVETSFSGGKMRHEGTEVAMPEGAGAESHVARFNAKGEEIGPKKEEDDEGDEGSFGAIFGGLSNFNPPEGTVKKGDKWSREVKANPEKKTPAARWDYELTGPEKFGDFETVRVTYTSQELGGEKPTKAAGYFLIDAKDGTIVVFDSKAENVTLDEETTATVKLKMVRE